LCSDLEKKMDIYGRTPALRGLNAPTRPLVRGLASALGLTAALHYCSGTALASHTFIVNTTGDPGPIGTLSLRQAVDAAAAGDTVQFDPSLSGSTITLSTGQIYVSHEMSIVGPGMDRLTISGAGSSRIFYLYCVAPNSVVSISSLSLTNGNAATGGALTSYDCYTVLSGVRATASHATWGGCITFNGGKITNSIVSGCSASSAGGGIRVTYGFANTTIEQSTISSNNAVLGGGGVFLDNASETNFTRLTTISQSTINNNHATATSGIPYGGGGIAVRHSIFNLLYSTVAQNNSHMDGGGISFADSYSANYSKVSRATVAHNSAYKTGGNGLHTVGGNLLVSYSIIADNFNIYGLTDLSGTFTVHRSLIQSTAGATITGYQSLFGADPDLAKLDDYGGPTATMLPNPGSPVIDTISNCFLGEQRGLPPCVNGKADMGAVERQVPEVIIFRDGFESG
jgi:hypothetical protein